MFAFGRMNSYLLWRHTVALRLAVLQITAGTVSQIRVSLTWPQYFQFCRNFEADFNWRLIMWPYWRFSLDRLLIISEYSKALDSNVNAITSHSQGSERVARKLDFCLESIFAKRNVRKKWRIQLSGRRSTLCSSWRVLYVWVTMILTGSNEWRSQSLAFTFELSSVCLLYRWK